MQTGSKQLEAQQRVMEALGFYRGKIDGIWGPKTIQAKKKWEGSGKFSPAIPNNGLPLADRGPLPKGVSRQADGMLTCVELQTKKEAPKEFTPPKEVVKVLDTPKAKTEAVVVKTEAPEVSK